MLEEEKAARLKELKEQSDKLHQEMSDLSYDPNHPILKPGTLFSIGEEVNLQDEGNTVIGKITGIREDGKYDVAILSLVARTEDELQKITVSTDL